MKLSKFILLCELIKADFKNRYLAHHFGIFWALIQPFVMVGVYWFVFTKGFGVVVVSNTSFLLWLLSGMVPWFLINDAIVSASYSIYSQAYLVKKMVFDVRLLPLIKIGSALLVNLGFWGFLFILCFYEHHYPTFIWLQLIYYLVCIIAISISLSTLFAAIMPFAADIGQVLTIFFQILFWVTPITWNYQTLPENWRFMINLNPFAYIINGVRETIIDQEPFWHNSQMTIYFWLFIFCIAWLSYRTFTKLRPHFADVL